MVGSLWVDVVTRQTVVIDHGAIQLVVGAGSQITTLRYRAAQNSCTNNKHAHAGYNVLQVYTVQLN